MNQRGVIPISLILYGVAAAALVGALWWAVDEWQDGQEAQRVVKEASALCPGDKPLVECVREEVAARQRCEKEYGVLLESVRKQNAAVARLEEQAKKAADQAKAARREADKAHASTQGERERLARLEKEFKAVGTCPAGQAVQEVRKGLRP